MKKRFEAPELAPQSSLAELTQITVVSGDDR
jgi:hypothetical protein